MAPLGAVFEYAINTSALHGSGLTAVVSKKNVRDLRIGPHASN